MARLQTRSELSQNKKKIEQRIALDGKSKLPQAKVLDGKKKPSEIGLLAKKENGKRFLSKDYDTSIPLQDKSRMCTDAFEISVRMADEVLKSKRKVVLFDRDALSLFKNASSILRDRPAGDVYERTSKKDYDLYRYPSDPSMEKLLSAISLADSIRKAGENENVHSLINASTYDRLMSSYPDATRLLTAKMRQLDYAQHADSFEALSASDFQSGLINFYSDKASVQQDNARDMSYFKKTKVAETLWNKVDKEYYAFAGADKGSKSSSATYVERTEGDLRNPDEKYRASLYVRGYDSDGHALLRDEYKEWESSIKVKSISEHVRDLIQNGAEVIATKTSKDSPVRLYIPCEKTISFQKQYGVDVVRSGQYFELPTDNRSDTIENAYDVRGKILPPNDSYAKCALEILALSDRVNSKDNYGKDSKEHYDYIDTNSDAYQQIINEINSAGVKKIEVPKSTKPITLDIGLQTALETNMAKSNSYQFG